MSLIRNIFDVFKGAKGVAHPNVASATTVLKILNFIFSPVLKSEFRVQKEG
jgi:hypothetical protein